MAGMYTTHMHLPRMVDMKEKVAEFWQEEAALSQPRKHTLQPIVTGLMFKTNFWFRGF